MKFVAVAFLLIVSCVAFEATYEQVQDVHIRRSGTTRLMGQGGGGILSCIVNTIPYTSLTNASGNQEFVIVTGQVGNYRYDQILLSPSTPFTGGGATSPVASMGRTGTNNSELTAGLVPIGSGSTYYSARPIPPQITSTYNVVINIAVGSGNVNTFTAGSLDYEVCGYPSH